jgi:hypothetical protein
MQPSGQINLQSPQAIQLTHKNFGFLFERQEPVRLRFDEPGFPTNGPNILV